MESSGSSAKAQDIPGHRWARVVGTAIALLTLAAPTVIIAHFSTADPSNVIPPPAVLPNRSAPQWN